MFHQYILDQCVKHLRGWLYPTVVSKQGVSFELNTGKPTKSDHCCLKFWLWVQYNDFKSIRVSSQAVSIIYREKKTNFGFKSINFKCQPLIAKWKWDWSFVPRQLEIRFETANGGACCNNHSLLPKSSTVRLIPLNRGASSQSHFIIKHNFSKFGAELLIWVDTAATCPHSNGWRFFAISAGLSVSFSVVTCQKYFWLVNFLPSFSFIYSLL